MSQRLQIRMDKELYDDIVKYKIENDFTDEQAVVREILREKFQKNKSFLSKLFKF